MTKYYKLHSAFKNRPLINRAIDNLMYHIFRHYKFNTAIFCSIVLMAFAACSPDTHLPSQYTNLDKSPNIYPDYTNITIPPNIAPLNFKVNAPDGSDKFIAEIKGCGKDLIASCDADEPLQFDTLEWRQMLYQAKGKTLTVNVYAHSSGGWVLYKPFQWQIAPENIDDYLSYRLIEPGYEIYRQLGLYQRNLTNYDERVIYENGRIFDEKNNHCINCHNYQNYSTKNMMFHVRGKHGGTVISLNGKLMKMSVKNDSILGSAVYPSWHPTKPWIVFSSNKTGQAFHIFNRQKVEVMDEASDLLFYDAEHNVVRNILRTKDALETFPCWNPAGNRIFYCVAKNTRLTNAPDSLRQQTLMMQYDSIRYNLMSMPFDIKTQTFGQPQMEFNCVSINKSVSVPRVSPDGRYVLFTLGDYGQFHIWHKSSDLWIKDLQTGIIRPLTQLNSKDVDSYHTWSSNGRWIVFSSRRDDGSYTRLYIAYFDNKGIAHKAFLLPQADPEENLLRLKSYNVPELTKDNVKISPAQFKACIFGDANNAEYQPTR